MSSAGIQADSLSNKSPKDRLSPYWMIQDTLQLKLPAVQHAGLSSYASFERHKDTNTESKKPKSANSSQQLIRIYLNKRYEHAAQTIIL